MVMMPDQVGGRLHKETTLAEQMDAVRSMSKGGGSGSNKFADTLLLLSEVTAQLAELDEQCLQAMMPGENENAEARKWREISASTMKFAQTSLLDQQLRAIEILQDLSLRGCSVIKGPDQDSGEIHTIPECNSISNASGALKGESKSCTRSTSKGVFTPPPGLSAPPGLEPPQEAEEQKMFFGTSADEGSWYCAVNLDAYDSDSDSD